MAVLAFAVFCLNGGPLPSSDNKAALLLPHALLTRGSIDLRPYFEPGAAAARVPYFYRQNGALLSSDKLVFASIVDTPFYAVAWAAVRGAGGPLPPLVFQHYDEAPPLAWVFPTYLVGADGPEICGVVTPLLFYCVRWLRKWCHLLVPWTIFASLGWLVRASTLVQPLPISGVFFETVC